MWLVAMFDLPVDTKAARREYARLRKLLLRNGFARMQFSVYVLPCGSEERAERYARRIQEALPPAGELRLLFVTDKQFARMRVFWGNRRKLPERKPTQLEFF